MSRIFQLFLFIVVCLSAGWLGSLATETSRLSWYAGLQKPPLNPPDFVFAPVWTVLYVLMAVAGWRIWHAEVSNRSRLRFLFTVQLLLNGVWSVLFFQLRIPLLALADIVFLWISLFILTVCAWRADRVAGLLLVPYVGWVSFAVYLNAAIAWLNR
jgi:translocator protein